jgi:hypothetical protein
VPTTKANANAKPTTSAAISANGMRYCMIRPCVGTNVRSVGKRMELFHHSKAILPDGVGNFIGFFSASRHPPAGVFVPKHGEMRPPNARTRVYVAVTFTPHDHGFQRVRSSRVVNQSPSDFPPGCQNGVSAAPLSQERVSSSDWPAARAKRRGFLSSRT